MSENIFEENNSFNDYYKTENFDDNNDLQSRLYAEIYYESNIESESRTKDISSTIRFDTAEIDIEPKSVQHKDKQPSESEAAKGKYNKALKKRSKTFKRVLQSEHFFEGSSIAEPLVCDDTLRTQNSDSHISVKIQKLHSVGQMESVKTNRDKLPDRETNSVTHECNNTNNDSTEDPSMKEKKETKKNSSKKHKSFSHMGNKHQENQDIPSKYNVLSKYEKQQILLAKQNKDKQVSDSSDSEESILEVPVPPKPKPPLINLQDSDEDNNINSGIDEDLSLERVTNCELKIIEVPNNCQDISYKNKSIDKSQHNKNTLVNSNIFTQIPTRAEEIRENIVLNCTTIQKGARDISEIQQLSKSADIDRNQGVSTEYTNQSSKKKSPQNKSRENNVNVQQDISVISYKEQPLNKADKKARNTYDTQYLKFVESIRTENNNAKRNVRYFKHEGQDNILVDTYNNLVMDGKRQCDSKIDRNPKQKRQCTIKQININITRQSSNNGEKRSESLSDQIFKPMPEEMRNYYCNSTRGQENFDISELQRDMSKDPRMWAILDEDLMPCPSSRQRIGSRNIRCNNCQQDGHHRYNCSLPRRAQTCYICGMKGHNETRCSQKMCLTCGKQQSTLYKTCKYCRVLYCTMCNSIGHEWEQCPDLWRRYHQTTDMNNTPQNPGNVMKPPSMLHCCNCTKRGHDSSMCREFRWSQHFSTPAAVTNYTDGPMYMPNATSSSQSNFEMSTLSPMTIDDILLPQDSNNMQQATEEYLELSTNADALTSSTKANRTRMPQEGAGEEEDLRSSLMVDKARLPEEKQKTHCQNVVNEQMFVDIIYSYGKFRNKDQKNARMILKSLFSDLSYYGRKFVTRSLTNHKIFKPVFLRTLCKKADIKGKFEVTIGITTCNRTVIMLQLIAMKDYIEQIYDLLIHWINLPDDEKKYGVEVTLPTNYTKMYNLLSSKEPQLKKMRFTCYNEHIEGFNDPRWLFKSIKHEKMKLEQHTGTKTHRNQYHRLCRKLWRSQIKLLMIFNTEPTPNVHVCMFQNAVKSLRQKRDWNKKLDAATYIKLILLYNHLFVPHTPIGLFKTLYRIEKQEKKIGKNTEYLPQVHDESGKRMMYEQENFTSYNDVNPTLLPSATSCTLQDTNFIENPSSSNIQHSSNDNILVGSKNVSDISSKVSDTINHNCEKVIVIDDFVVRDSQVASLNTEPLSVQSEHSERNEDQLSTSDVNIRDSQVALLNSEPASVQSEHPKRNEDQLSTSDVNIRCDIFAGKQNVNEKPTTHLTKKQKKAMKRKEKQKETQAIKDEIWNGNINDVASKFIKEARAFNVSYMTNAANELQRNMNNQMIKRKHLQSVYNLIKLEKKFQKRRDFYSKNLKE